MPESLNLGVEIVRALLGFITVAVLGGVVATVFARVRYRRELDMSAAARFYEVYGVWFATWKRWSALKAAEGNRAQAGVGADALGVPVGSRPATDLSGHRRPGLRRGGHPASPDFRSESSSSPVFEAARTELLVAAAQCEGQFEALLIKISIERRLREGEIERMSRFREGYQRLRECIEADVDLPWRVQYAEDRRSAYVAFKSSSVEFATLVSRAGRSAPAWIPRTLRRKHSRLARAQRNFVKLTSWRVAGSRDKELWWKDKGAGSQELAVRAWKHLPDVSSSWRVP